MLATPKTVNRNGKNAAITAPEFESTLWIPYAYDFCSSLTISPIIILNGCIAIFAATSKIAIAIAPNTNASIEPYPKPKLPMFGKNNIIITAKIIPINK